jgi:alanyl-tRNA synthetase
MIDERRQVPIDTAKSMGAMALFGEKYGEEVRMIIFDPAYSIELCGGTHVPATGQIGLFKIVSESAIAAGIRRIEAVTGKGAEEFVYTQQAVIEEIQEMLKGSKDLVRGVRNLAEENRALLKKVEELNSYRLEALKAELLQEAENINGVRFIARKIEGDAKAAKDIAFHIPEDAGKIFILLITTADDKTNLTLSLSSDLVKEKGLHAGNLVKELAKEINGGGGGQPHFATAGGSNSKGIPAVIENARKILQNL